MTKPNRSIRSIAPFIASIATSAAAFLLWKQKKIIGQLKKATFTSRQLSVTKGLTELPDLYGYIEYAVLAEQLKQVGAGEDHVAEALRISTSFMRNIDQSLLELLPACFEEYVVNECKRKFGHVGCTSCGDKSSCERYCRFAASQQMNLAADTTCSIYSYNQQGVASAKHLYLELAAKLGYSYGLRVEAVRKRTDEIFARLASRTTQRRVQDDEPGIIDAYLQCRDHTSPKTT